MKYFSLVLALLVSACGSAPAASVPKVDFAPVAPSANTYTYRVVGSGITFAGVIYTNFADADQGEVATGVRATTGNDEFSVTGRNSTAQFSFNSGTGTLEVHVYRNGVLNQTQALTASGTAVWIRTDI